MALVVLVAAPLVAHIPIAALAGVLLATCIQMIEVGSLAAVVRSTRGDAAILVLTLAVTVLTDLWTFARDTRNRDPNWALVRTEEPS